MHLKVIVTLKANIKPLNLERLTRTHFMEEAEYCDNMIIMSRGTTLASGTPCEIRDLAKSKTNSNPTVEDAFIALAEGVISPLVKGGGDGV